ncbi:MAG: vacuolar import and degradation protein-domain-containing protein [Linnemannia elongata]|nr:MAG: vacuolar import and degradation protein-domain-containing protein [Linnemannia elongata]
MPVFARIATADPVEATAITTLDLVLDTSLLSESSSSLSSTASTSTSSPLCCHLYPESKFEGKQQSGTNSYDVVVDIKHVNLNDSTLCGYLHIKGLTREYPELTTFFDAEIIGPQYSFLTRKWDATEDTDQEHWALFQQFQGSMYNMEAHQNDLKDGDVVFMRWKEHFLVPDHRVEGITGASFAGFYYICYNKRTGHINGYYYHQSSEKFQQLTLSHVEERKSFGSYEFR